MLAQKCYIRQGGTLLLRAKSLGFTDKLTQNRARGEDISQALRLFVGIVRRLGRVPAALHERPKLEAQRFSNPGNLRWTRLRNTPIQDPRKRGVRDTGSLLQLQLRQALAFHLFFYAVAKL